MKSRVVVSAIIKKGDKYLLGQKRKDVGPYPNTWHLIGGGVELENETLEEGIRREIREEAGIEVGELSRFTFDEDNEPDKNGIMTHYLFLVYDAEYKSGEVMANDDIAELAWFTEDELKSIPLTRPLKKRLLEKGIL